MSKYLVVVDMQNDFIDGSLGTPEAKSIVSRVVSKIRQCKANGYQILFTMDRHDENYLETQEGKHLPVRHCIYGERGWQIHHAIKTYANEEDKIFQKYSFISNGVLNYIFDNETEPIEEIEICGLCTDICVISNALNLKSSIPEAKLVVDAKCCAGTTPENHKKALDVMKSCQINIINEEDKVLNLTPSNHLYGLTEQEIIKRLDEVGLKVKDGDGSIVFTDGDPQHLLNDIKDYLADLYIQLDYAEEKGLDGDYEKGYYAAVEKITSVFEMILGWYDCYGNWQPDNY